MEMTRKKRKQAWKRVIDSLGRLNDIVRSGEPVENHFRVSRVRRLKCGIASRVATEPK